MITELQDPGDRQLACERIGQGVCHISDVLPLVLARITAMTQSDMDCRPRSVHLVSHIMPAPGVMAEV
jgi:hypothetical protein